MTQHGDPYENAMAERVNVGPPVRHSVAHLTDQPLKKHWKPKVYKRGKGMISTEPQNNIDQ
ncbi:hypothetical protein GO755_26385 [Spirosoma sp. HMF4905]|uniref:Uncharacterized protein n=1 Tax=Spirosoma arboris TaxID=2682092 RepID=A0A7K1SIP6_9BACT|nr:hypothetical protein [Spirosoma arboris]